MERVISNIAYDESLSYNYNIEKYKYNTNVLIIEIINTNIYIVQKSYEARTNDTINFIKKVLEMTKHNLDGIYCIGMDDASHNHKGLLVFSKTMGEQNVLIPDLYATYNYNGKLNINDNIDNKKNEMIFVGSSTGNYNPLFNNRLKICNDALKYPDTIKCYISNVCQISKEKIKNVFPLYENFLSNNLSIEEQLNYKYIISIDGNTSAWDRVPWILNSKSILVKHKSDELCWYYYLLKKNVHYLEFETVEDLKKILDENKNYDYIIKNANDFVKKYLTLDIHLKYMEQVLFHIKNNKDKLNVNN
jgi:hypothetical protein